MTARTTPLFAWHAAHGARFTDFAGWKMPVQYRTGAIAEHTATRTSVGVFDISHMGQVRVTGNAAAAWLAGLVTADITQLAERSSTYALLCDPEGGVIDDLFIYRTKAHEFLVVVNASRREVDVAWFKDHLRSPHAEGVQIRDESDRTAMVAVQGPRALELLSHVWGGAVDALPRFGYISVSPRGGGTPLEVTRTGYTGEDGVEVFLHVDDAPAVWEEVFRTASAVGIHTLPVGLAARDTLRLEAGFALYGHELTTEVTPVEARLTWACDLGHQFVGCEAIKARKENKPDQTLRRLIVSGNGVAREGYRLFNREGKEVGRVVSGGKSPSASAFIANGYVSREVGATEELSVEIRSRRVAVVQHRGPIYKPRYQRLASVGRLFDRTGEYRTRHIGPRERDLPRMLEQIGVASVEELIAKTVPSAIRGPLPSVVPPALSEQQALARIRSIADHNTVLRSLIGLGYADTVTPTVIARNILENPLWYTSYTPYQAEVSQGRLEALLNFQTMVSELTALDIANASLLDESTAAAEAMTMALRHTRSKTPRVWIDNELHPQTIALLTTRARPIGVTVEVAPVSSWRVTKGDIAGFVQYPDTRGVVHSYATVSEELHAAGALMVACCDLLSLTILTPPGEWGADIAVGNSQRFGVSLGYGGPHAAFMATTAALKRIMPGRLVGVSKDRSGKPALRLALQTREQHIRRDKATSNICTAQALLASLASMYAVYHGPDGLRRIAERITLLAHGARDILREEGFPVLEGPIFDTITLTTPRVMQQRLVTAACHAGFNLRAFPGGETGIALDEKSSPEEVADLLSAMGIACDTTRVFAALEKTDYRPPIHLERHTDYLTEEVFHRYHGETLLLRYITQLQSKDVSLAHSMIALGSCTMKLNPTTAMVPITWPQFADIHPYAPAWQAGGYQILRDELVSWLSDITGFAGGTLQPNSGAHGEYTGLMVIRSWHESRREQQRDVCLIPDSAHGTNPASAVMAGMRVVVVNSAPNGDIDLVDLAAKAELYQEKLAALMVTYPSTHGVFEEGIREAIEIVHRHGGQVYMDGANMNGQVAITSPGFIGADVCHLNLHKTFAIPHGGGGPGVGPIFVAEHLLPYLPGTVNQPGPTGVVVGAPEGSAGIFAIPYLYIAMMGPNGLRQATESAIVNANYIASRVRKHLPIVYTGVNGFVAHECILDFRQIEKETGVTVEDVAKRLSDYGFHAPTMSWPVHSTLMVEPTESEDLEELDRFCDAIGMIAEEINDVRQGRIALEDSPLVYAPHTAEDISGPWQRPYTREQGAFPAPWLRIRKVWPGVGRVDNAHGDRNLVCTCAPLEAYQSEGETITV